MMTSLRTPISTINLESNYMKTKNRKIKLGCLAEDAESVFVAGTFNDWSASSIPLKKGRNGNWSTTVDLPSGRHEYKFIIDGRWCCKPGCHEHEHACPDCVPNDCGSMNRVLEVEP